MASNDWRWYLFFIPLVLAFFAIVGLVFYTHRRRRILKARRSTLRNVTLVLEEDEKVKQRQEKLERMSSVRSNLSRMTSTKSTYSRSAIGRDVEREHRRLRATTSRNGGGRGGGETAEAEKGLEAVQQDQIHVIGRDNHHVEADGVYDLSNQNRRKEMLSVIGESQGESSRISNTFNSDDAELADPSLASVVASSSTPSKPPNGKPVSNHDLQAIPSTSSGGGDRGGDPFITPVTATSQTNPFASPQNSSSDHDNPSSSSAIPIPPPTSQPNKNGLARKLSEVVRLRSPIPRSTPSKSTDSSEKDRVSPTVAKVSTDTFGVKANTRPSGSGSGSGSQPEGSQNQLSLPLNNGRTSTSSSRSAVTTQMIGAPSSPNILASPIRSNSIDASTATNTNTNTNPVVGGSEWTYISRADQWRKPGRKSLETSNQDGRDYLNKDPNPLGLSNVSLGKKSPSLKAQSATHLPLPKQNRNDSNDGSGLKRAVSIGAAGSKFKETFDDSP